MIRAPERPSPEANEKLGRWVLAGLVLAVVAGGAWYYTRMSTTEVADPAAGIPEELPLAAAEPKVRHPIDAPAPEPLPAPDLRDPTAAERIAELIGAERFQALLLPDEIVRRMVVTVDNLPRQKVAVRLSPAQPLQGSFVALGDEDGRIIGVANFARYAPWVEMIDTLRMDSVVAVYKRLYPQFQSAYQDLGHPDGYFNDRLIEVIDHLLETPEPPATLALVRPNVMYEFADPALESRSAGQKLLLRMGAGNAARVKAKLAEFRARIATGD